MLYAQLVKEIFYTVLKVVLFIGSGVSIAWRRDRMEVPLCYTAQEHKNGAPEAFLWRVERSLKCVLCRMNVLLSRVRAHRRART